MWSCWNTENYQNNEYSQKSSLLRVIKNENSRLKNTTQGWQIKAKKEREQEPRKERRQWKRICKNQTEHLNTSSNAMKTKGGGFISPPFLFLLRKKSSVWFFSLAMRDTPLLHYILMLLQNVVLPERTGHCNREYNGRGQSAVNCDKYKIKKIEDNCPDSD